MQKQLLEFDFPQPLSNALLFAPSSVTPSFPSVPAAHRRLATMMVNGMGGRAVPLLESVIACCSTSLTEPHGEERGDRAQQDNHASLLLNKCPGHLLLRLHNFMPSSSWTALRGASNHALGRYRVFACRVRDEAGVDHVRQLTVLTSRLFNQEILPLDYALAVTRLLSAHAHLLDALFEILSNSGMGCRGVASPFKLALWANSERHRASPRKAPAALLPSSPASARQSKKHAAARARVLPASQSQACSWGGVQHIMPSDAKQQATRSLSQFVFQMNPN